MQTTAKEKKLEDIIKDAEGIECPVSRTLYVLKGFLNGPMCGKCHPCSLGSFEAMIRVEGISNAGGRAEDIDALRKIAGLMEAISMCKKGKDVGKYVNEAIKSEEFLEHVNGKCRAHECKAFIEYRNIQDRCIRCGLCQEACRFDAIMGEKQISHKCCFQPFEIRQKRCTKCGECIKVCPTNAIVIVDIETEAGVKAE